MTAVLMPLESPAAPPESAADTLTAGAARSADTCAGAVDGDFNGDGARDTAIADPQATVDGASAAGAVHVVDGASGAVTVLHQNLTEVPGTALSNDAFGHAIAVYDANRDGCADLAVSAPGEGSWDGVAAGSVTVLLGSRAGLAKGPAATVLQQGQPALRDAQEAGDRFGYALAAGNTAAGEPYLLIGVPGEDIGGIADAGVVHYLRGSFVLTLSQSSPGGDSDGPETDDRFGYSVAGSPGHVAVGAPGESIGSHTWAGAVTTFTHEVTANTLRFAVELHQNAANVSDWVTADDQFGKAVALAPYRPAGAAPGDSLLAIGVPGDENTVDGTPRVDAGRVHRFHLAGTGAAELPALTYESEDGDAFGERLVLVNTAPEAESTPQNLLLAVGTPGEDRGQAPDAGVVRVFAAAANPGGQAVHVERGDGRLPGSPAEGELLGLALGGNGRYLFVASAYRERTVYALAWSAVVAGTPVPERIWRSGQGGFPTGGGSFGEVVR